MVVKINKQNMQTDDISYPLYEWIPENVATQSQVAAPPHREPALGVLVSSLSAELVSI